jgi:putative membrane protein
MVALPLARPGSARRATISNLVVGGLAATTTASASARWGPARTSLAAGVVGAGTALVERVGTATGWPFGRYRYTGRLRPAVGEVPVAVPAAWWAMALPARAVAHAALGRRSSRLARVLVGAAALTAWDLFLDPQMTAEGYWRWDRRGRYAGIPLSNYAGWFVTGAAVMLALDVVLPPDAHDAPDGWLVGEYVGMGAMEALGFALFFGDRLVAAVGSVGMLPLGAWAWARLALGHG